MQRQRRTYAKPSKNLKVNNWRPSYLTHFLVNSCRVIQSCEVWKRDIFAGRSHSAVGITNDILVAENSVANMLKAAADSNSMLKAPKPAIAMAVSKSVSAFWEFNLSAVTPRVFIEITCALSVTSRGFVIVITSLNVGDLGTLNSLLSYTYHYVAHYSDFKRVAKTSALY
uniref:Uncharacterized protein n=1 Tax=Glossina austeni TaxID=7395 RepID=A0A1A9VEM8_GLOAU